MHFLDTVKMTMAVVLSQNHPAYFREMRKKEQEAEDDHGFLSKFLHLEKQQQKRQKYDQTMNQRCVFLAEEVASLKIQVMFKGRQERRRFEARKAQAADRKQNALPPA